jgi:hypothetical protein
MSMETLILDPSDALFRGQFLLGPSFFSAPEWSKQQIFNGLCLSSGPELALAFARSADNEIVCLGDIYDTRNPGHDNRQVLENLVRSLSNFSDFEMAARSAGGRWLILLRIGNEIRAYPDPTGSIPLYYCESGDLWVGNTPQIIAEALHLEKDKQLIAEFNSHRRGDWWPGEITPYKQILHMMPNHYYDLIRREPRRFWPVVDIPPVDIYAGITGILKLLHQIILAASYRYELYMAITGGYDSRAVLAGARGLHDKIKFFTVAYPGIKNIDIEIPRRIARQLRLDYRIIPYVEPSQEFLDLFDRNSAGMVSGQCRLNAMTYQKFPRSILFVEGAASPIGKASYYKYAAHPETITPMMLCKYAGCAENPVALRAFEKWLGGVPSSTNVKILDLFYWEQRMGSWNAMDFTSQGMTRKVFSPFNCREILELMLGVPDRDRQYPHRLHQKMCDQALPELRFIRFNSTWIDNAKKIKKRIFKKFAAILVQSIDKLK